MKRILLTAVGCILYVPCLFADNLSAYDSRRQIIQQSLNCIDHFKNESSSVSWQDVCLMDSYESSKRQELINNTLNNYERVSKRPKPEVISLPPENYSSLTKEVENVYLPSVQKDSFKMDIRTQSDSLLGFKLGIYGGYRQDDFNWNIADSDGHPDVLSDLEWKKLKMSQLQAVTTLTVKDSFLLEGMGSYADIFEGENQDSDYAGDGRSFEFSRSNNAADDGNVMEWSAGIGYRWPINGLEHFLEKEETFLTILGGYSRHELNVIATDAVQTVPALGPFDGLHTNYWAEWNGPWVGLQLEASIKKLKGIFRYEFHWADYYGSANWNLREEFKHPTSFEQITEATGQFYTLGLDYQMNKVWSLSFKTDWKSWHSASGTDRIFFIDDTTLDSPFNEVNWSSIAFMLGVICHFN